MTETNTTEVQRNTGKDVLVSIALIAIAVIAAVLYLWISFAPRREDVKTVRDKPWDLTLSADMPLEQQDLEAVRAVPGVERVELDDNAQMLYIHVSAAADRVSYEAAVTSVESALTALAAEKEAERVEKLQAEYDHAAEGQTGTNAEKLAELASEQEKLDAQALQLEQMRQRLDRERSALQERETALNTVRTGLNRDGRALNEAEAWLSIQDDSAAGDAYRDSVRQYSRERDMWFAGGEDYLDALTVYEQDKARLERLERDYAAELSRYEEESARLEELRRSLEESQTVQTAPEITDCTWKLARNPEAGVLEAPEEPKYSPLRLSLQMLFLAVAALCVWLFFARLLSAMAGRITKPRAAQEQVPGEASEAYTAGDES